MLGWSRLCGAHLALARAPHLLRRVARVDLELLHRAEAVGRRVRARITRVRAFAHQLHHAQGRGVPAALSRDLRPTTSFVRSASLARKAPSRRETLARAPPTELPIEPPTRPFPSAARDETSARAAARPSRRAPHRRAVRHARIASTAGSSSAARPSARLRQRQRRGLIARHRRVEGATRGSRPRAAARAPHVGDRGERTRTCSFRDNPKPPEAPPRRTERGVERLHREPVGLRGAAGPAPPPPPTPPRGGRRRRVGLTRRRARGPRRARPRAGPAGAAARGHPFFSDGASGVIGLGGARPAATALAEFGKWSAGGAASVAAPSFRASAHRKARVHGSGAGARLVFATRPRGCAGKRPPRGRAARPERVTAGERDGGGPRGAGPGGPAASLPVARRAERRRTWLSEQTRVRTPAPPHSLTSGLPARRAIAVRRGGSRRSVFRARREIDVIRERRELHRGELRQAQGGLQRLSRANVAVEDVLRAGCASGGHFPRRRASDAPVPERRVNVTRSRAQLASKLVLKRAFQLHRVPHGRAGREGVEAPRHPHRRRCASRFRPADAPGRVPRAADAPTIALDGFKSDLPDFGVRS